MSDRTLRIAVAVLALAGAAIAGYLTYAKYADATIACSTGGCETVQESEYAEILGLPVPVLGLAGYLAIFATALPSALIGLARPKAAKLCPPGPLNVTRYRRLPTATFVT